MKRLLGFCLLGIGAMLLANEFIFSRHASFFNVAFGIGAALIGWKLSRSVGSKDTARRGSQPRLPEGFHADFWHKNIALDKASNRVWLREKDGKQGVFQTRDLVGWEMQWANFNSQAVIGPRLTPMDNRLIVKTKDLEKPVWTIPFDAHGSITGRACHRNHEEMKAWYERLNVFINHTS